MQTQSSIGRLKTLLPDVFTPQRKTAGELYLKFRLGNNLNAVIALEQVVETLRIPAENITPIPNMPPSNLGLMGSQSKVFWAIDLPQLLNLPRPAVRPREYEIIVVKALPMDNSAMGVSDEVELLLGLSVPQIQRTLRLSTEDIGSCSDRILPQLVPYTTGVIQEEEQDGEAGDELLVFNVEAIANAKGLSSE